MAMSHESIMLIITANSTRPPTMAETTWPQPPPPPFTTKVIATSNRENKTPPKLSRKIQLSYCLDLVEPLSLGALTSMATTIAASPQHLHTIRHRHPLGSSSIYQSIGPLPPPPSNLLSLFPSRVTATAHLVKTVNTQSISSASVHHIFTPLSSEEAEDKKCL